MNTNRPAQRGDRLRVTNATGKVTDYTVTHTSPYGSGLAVGLRDDQGWPASITLAADGIRPTLGDKAGWTVILLGRASSILDDQAHDLAVAIAALAQTIADGTVAGPVGSAVARLQQDVATLAAWTSDDQRKPTS